MLSTIFLTMVAGVATVRAQFGTHRHPDLSERVPHNEHHIPEEDIIELPIGRFPDPICEYSVHWNDRNGAIVNHTVRIGDALYHKWKCHYPVRTLNVYCMMVYNCTIGNVGRSEQIIDHQGCTKFPSVLPHVNYVDDLEAGVNANVFALDVDHPTVFFNCAIRLLIKDRGACPRPICDLQQWSRSRLNRSRLYRREQQHRWT